MLLLLLLEFEFITKDFSAFSQNRPYELGGPINETAAGPIYGDTTFFFPLRLSEIDWVPQYEMLVLWFCPNMDRLQLKSTPFVKADMEVKIKISTNKTQTAAVPDHSLTASITRTAKKLRIFAITVITMAVCQFLGQCSI